MESAEHRQIDFSEDSDDDLLGYMAMQDEEPEGARQAYAVFYLRHIKWLKWAVPRSNLGRLLPPGDEEDVVQDTFLRAYEKAGTFDSSVVAESKRRGCRAWLGRIATNIIKDRLKIDISQKNSSIEEIKEKDLVESLWCSKFTRDSKVVRLVEEATENLTEREKDVLLEWQLWYKPGERNQRLPNDVSRDLANRWGTTTDHIRMIRYRAFKKIASHVERSV
jgi:RNA polymerase sigma factor (sigma-70 family)